MTDKFGNSWGFWSHAENNKILREENPSQLEFFLPNETKIVCSSVTKKILTSLSQSHVFQVMKEIGFIMMRFSKAETTTEPDCNRYLKCKIELLLYDLGWTREYQ